MTTNTRILSSTFIFCFIFPFLATALPADIDQLLQIKALAEPEYATTGAEPEPVEPVKLLDATNGAEPKPVDGLRMNFYEPSCPNAEQIVQEVLTKANQDDPGLAAAMLRLHAHDCFVKGCDASILLDKSPKGGRSEKTAAPNGMFIRGLEIVDQIKARLETECPNVVSCADVLAYAARDALVLSGIPRYEVPGGRRDGLTSTEESVVTNVPLPDNNIDTIIDLFERKGLNIEDLVVLTGAHSIGVSHCGNFAYRVFDRVKRMEIDPRLLALIRFVCVNDRSALPFDSMTQYTMDSGYYKLLLFKRGLIESDQLMANDPKTRAFVELFSKDQDVWFQKFVAAMVKMSKIEVLTGNAGEIRKNCHFVNKK